MAGLCFSSWASRIPNIKTLLHLNDAQLGNVLFALPVGLMASLPISGWMVTRFGSKVMVIAGLILYAATLSMLGMVSTVLQLVITLFVFGLAANLVNISVNTQAVLVESSYGRSIMASFHGAWSLAGFTGAAIALGLISIGITLPVHFYIMTLLVFVLIALFQKNLFAASKAPASQPVFVKPDKLLLQLGLIGFFGMASEGAMFDWSGVYFQKIVQPPAVLVPLGFTAFMSTMAGGRFIGDYVTNRIGRKRTLQISGILIASGLGIAVAFPSLITATIGFLLVGFGVSSVVPLVYAAAGRSGSMPAGMALAAVSSVSFLGFLLGPPMIGWIAETANLKYSFALIAVLGFCITLLTSKAKLIE